MTSTRSRVLCGHEMSKTVTQRADTVAEPRQRGGSKSREYALHRPCMAARRSLRTLCLIALTALLLAAPAAGAVPALHTGSTRYVRIVHLGHGQLSVALTGQGRKRLVAVRLSHCGD